MFIKEFIISRSWQTRLFLQLHVSMEVVDFGAVGEGVVWSISFGET